ncbi:MULTISPECIES: NAD-dependent epimerase/dehydratase family protein [Micromonospora]|uniref:NAD-dependent epimerase/dehydratase family protein n=1 Tax=Micromonospora solifontis TaxID=2487138 RepID=A0ABX9WCF8_9ACTN|nr:MULTISPECIES: NAD-dependent epimerase/dehydratase family protein [Micromonospora]NES15768.1 NAD-dependent epimerase/dehydratase family protein [Micromonospora sp. PPF5-17B]NES38226.1 NAD-dependent epimerase/dehydratase family protein [Micromonospora solifontis]NES56614.1 NAD-dependent epimerase/dehydratase family protein [Micromonospora sp. PPF5-6]RNL96414.1 NAD-dependent epimerase/dehydratase family protein [Micromonospora solifontis]
MRIVIVGASGNVGTALLRRLRRESGAELVGVARRLPGPDAGEPYDGVEWHSCDIGDPDSPVRLASIFAGARAVVHLAWQIQPSHDRRTLWRTNVGGSRAVLDAAVRAGVPALVYASSVGTYAPGPKDHPVSERWPATGVPTSSYSRDKAEVEGLLDGLEREHPELRVVRLRPGLIFQRDAGTEISRYFLGPLVPVRLLRYGRIPLVPANRRLRVQAVHADDVADAYAKAVLGEARGAFNLAADPVLSPELVARHFHGWTVPVAIPVLRAAAALTWRARLQPVDVGWVDLALNVPLLSSERAESELDWRPRVDAVTALRDLFAGMAHRAGTPAPPLSPSPDLPGRPTALLKARLPGHPNPY